MFPFQQKSKQLQLQEWKWYCCCDKAVTLIRLITSDHAMLKTAGWRKWEMREFMDSIKQRRRRRPRGTVLNSMLQSLKQLILSSVVEKKKWSYLSICKLGNTLYVGLMNNDTRVEEWWTMLLVDNAKNLIRVTQFHAMHNRSFPLMLH